MCYLIFLSAAVFLRSHHKIGGHIRIFLIPYVFQIWYIRFSKLETFRTIKSYRQNGCFYSQQIHHLGEIWFCWQKSDFVDRNDSKRIFGPEKPQIRRQKLYGINPNHWNCFVHWNCVEQIQTIKIKDWLLQNNYRITIIEH